MSDFSFTDTGNAERLVSIHGDNIRYLIDEEIFCFWNGEFWERSTSGDVLLPLTKEITDSIADEKWQKASGSATKRRAMISLLKGERSLYSKRAEFDAHPFLLNVQNGTLDLETGNIRGFERNELLTKRARVTFDPFATCPKFDAFLELIFGGDHDVIHYILKVLGYSLTGDIGESCFFMLYGNGRNGKTTLVELLMQIMGLDFVTPAKFSTFIESKYDGQGDYDIATFAGARVITASEPTRSRRLNEELFKKITGGDVLKARQIRGVPFTFSPECKIWLAMNNKPRITGTDEGIWRRVRLIPFLHRIEGKPIKEYHKVLFAEEGPGILNRMLDGLRAWQEEGLESPSAVAKATNEFRESENTLNGFFTECCFTDKKSYCVKMGALYEVYKKWAEDHNEFVQRINEFSEELDKRNFPKYRTANEGAWRRGLMLKSDAKTDFDFDPVSVDDPSEIIQ